jgi:hypothetical protein
MPTTNPQIYYENDENWGNYQFVGLEEIVNNFIQNFTGDSSLLGYVLRSKVIYQAKQGIKQFTFEALHQVKVVELELGEANDVILPQNYVDYVRISWVNKQTGQIHPMSQNRHFPLGIAYLQDNEANILFDNNGEILEGTTAIEAINDRFPSNSIENFENFPLNGFGYWNGYTRYGIRQPIWNLDTSQNFNGTFTINNQRIHFGSDSHERIILLEYVSDGLDVLEADMKVHKYCENALYYFIYHQLSLSSIRIPNYEKRNIKKEYDTQYRNARVKMLGIKPQEFLQAWKAGKQTIR